jgi:O-glycosyl hydrolase
MTFFSLLLHSRILAAAGALTAAAPLQAAPTQVTVDATKALQTFDGLGCGAIFYEAHMTSLAARNKPEEQEKLYDVMFKDVRTEYLHLYIRHDHEPQNDNDDPWTPAFNVEDFKYCEHPLAICKAARERRPQMKFYATLYTPPAWMKTNNDPSGGGKQKATLKKGLELELGEYIWAFLDHMKRHGVEMHYLSIANEPDWPHTQPSYFLDPDQHAALFAKVADYLNEMAKRHPEVPRPKLVGPNGLSVIDATENYLPPLLRKAGDHLDIVGTHDYDRRGDRWKALTKAAKGRPVWGTEWCVNGPDDSPGLIRSAAEFWLAMSEAFNGGANVWMAYDWVYPPRQGGEALIHLNWGESWETTRIYHGFRQFASRLEPGMRVVTSTVTGPGASDFSKPGVKACAFRSREGKRVVLNVANVQDQPADIVVTMRGTGPGPTQAWLTSATDTLAPQPIDPAKNARLSFTLPPRGMLTVESGGTTAP